MTGLRRVDAHHQLARRDNAAVELSGLVAAAEQLTVGLPVDEHAALVGATAARACGLAWA